MKKRKKEELEENLLQILDEEIKISASRSSLAVAQSVWTATNSFPLMKFVNEHCSHLNDPLLMSAIPPPYGLSIKQVSIHSAYDMNMCIC